MASKLQFGEEQLVIHGHFKAASHARDEGDALDLWFEILQQFRFQAHGPVCIVSNHAVFDPDVHRSLSPLK